MSAIELSNSGLSCRFGRWDVGVITSKSSVICETLVMSGVFPPKRNVVKTESNITRALCACGHAIARLPTF
eukprot:m.145255 g.145255  ORF g.145255 m.145255 type:complete len:71 (-) comp23065_c0_seq1:1761-1973(-)